MIFNLTIRVNTAFARINTSIHVIFSVFSIGLKDRVYTHVYVYMCLCTTRFFRRYRYSENHFLKQQEKRSVRSETGLTVSQPFRLSSNISS